jgi:hypothetical protein
MVTKHVKERNSSQEFNWQNNNQMLHPSLSPKMQRDSLMSHEPIPIQSLFQYISLNLPEL